MIEITEKEAVEVVEKLKLWYLSPEEESVEDLAPVPNEQYLALRRDHNKVYQYWLEWLQFEGMKKDKKQEA